MTIHESAENYLKQILILLEKKGYARSVDIAAGLNVCIPMTGFFPRQLFI